MSAISRHISNLITKQRDPSRLEKVIRKSESFFCSRLMWEICQTYRDFVTTASMKRVTIETSLSTNFQWNFLLSTHPAMDGSLTPP